MRPAWRVNCGARTMPYHVAHVEAYEGITWSWTVYVRTCGCLTLSGCLAARARAARAHTSLRLVSLTRPERACLTRARGAARRAGARPRARGPGRGAPERCVRLGVHPRRGRVSRGAVL